MGVPVFWTFDVISVSIKFQIFFTYKQEKNIKHDDNQIFRIFMNNNIHSTTCVEY